MWGTRAVTPTLEQNYKSVLWRCLIRKKKEAINIPVLENILGRHSTENSPQNVFQSLLSELEDHQTACKQLGVRNT